MKSNKMFKKILALVAVVCVVFCMSVTAFATDGQTDYAEEAVSAIQSGLAEVTGTLNIGNILTVLLSVIGIAIGFMFFWWAIRKVLGIVKRAFTKGKVSV